MPRAGLAAISELGLAEYPLEDRMYVLEMMSEVEVFLQLSFAQVFAHVLVRREGGEEVGLALPGAHGVALDDGVGLLARHPLLREREHHPLGMNKAAEPLEVFLHVGGIDHELVDDSGEPNEREIERRRGIGRGHPFDRGVGDVALVPERHVLEPRRYIAAHHPATPRHVLRENRLALVWP